MAKRSRGCSGLGATPKRGLTRSEREKMLEAKAWNAGQRFALKHPCYLATHKSASGSEHLYREYMARLPFSSYFDVFKYGALDVWKRKRTACKR